MDGSIGENLILAYQRDVRFISSANESGSGVSSPPKSSFLRLARCLDFLENFRTYNKKITVSM